ncbi:MAG: toll/interleukin-1 receptor domain-containing protein [Chloroflexi bacterium]|nr:toll/interleukin-1 receptor domain-containing protein [Chloroflexota bacterium]MCC6897047.1 toll/interleukin-1 receptor domain-containing protein [Anaerolineae bacterium]
MPNVENARHIKVFISYRNIEHSKAEGDFLATQLRDVFGYEVFIDTQELKNKGGVKWQELIYDNIHTSDVLIVLLEQETHLSEWVQREVDVARGAHVSILPIVIIEENEIAKVLRDVQNKLAISEMQFLNFASSHPNYTPILESIESLSKKTRDSQKAWSDRLRDLRFARKAPIDNPFHAHFDVASGRKICLAAGDMSQMQNIDVLVNTENNYMQMARIYESNVLSSALRREGSWVKQGKMLEDTVQLDLDLQVTKGDGFGSRPIEMEQVIPTRAGHPKSALVKNGARYIFHASTVYVHPHNRKVTPIQTDAAVTHTTLNCLNLLMEVNANKGVISPEGTEAHEREQEAAAAFTPIKSIIFPLFGAGQGGRSTLEVASPMIFCFRDFLRKHDNQPDFTLESIHLCVYTEVDVAIVESLMGYICNA